MQASDSAVVMIDIVDTMLHGAADLKTHGEDGDRRVAELLNLTLQLGNNRRNYDGIEDKQAVSVMKDAAKRANVDLKVLKALLELAYGEEIAEHAWFDLAHLLS